MGRKVHRAIIQHRKNYDHTASALYIHLKQKLAEMHTISLFVLTYTLI